MAIGIVIFAIGVLMYSGAYYKKLKEMDADE